jgi:hypothetical protein
MKSLLSTAIKVLISALILYVLFRNINTDEFWATVVSVNPLYVVFVALLFACTQVVSTYRWRAILSKDIDIPYTKLLSIYYIGMFFNNFMPTMVGGDIIKGYYIYKHTGRGDISLASIFMDRYSGVTALIVVTAIALIPGWSLLKGTGLPGFFVLLIGSYLAISLVLWVTFLHRWVMRLLAKIHFYGINRKIETVYTTLMSYKTHRAILVKIFICSAVVQVGVMVGYYILSRGLAMTVPLGYFFLFIPLATVVSMLPVSLAGLGIREGAFVYLFTKVGSSQEQALTLSLMWFAIMACVSLIGGVEYLRIGRGAGAIPPQTEDRG